MDNFAKQSDQERKALLQEAASRRNSTEIILEKDFWVCWTLKRLFVNSDLAIYLTFKGGTSLSKAYGLIERFSEDIDLTINRNADFLKDTPNPMEVEISNKERKRRLETLRENTQLFVKEIALPALQADVETLLGQSGEWQVILDSDDPDQQTILFYYPKVFGYAGMSSPASYIRPHIKLEFGARGEIEPHETRSIMPYAAKVFPEQFENPSVDVIVLAAERTFWEKATILHSLHHGSKLRDRMSRHYYDTFMLFQHGVAKKAIKDPELLESVVRNKNLLFQDAKASYKTAKIGSLKLSPTAEQHIVLKKVYEKMAEMFMGEYPDFDTILNGLAELEQNLNASKQSG